MRIKSEIYLDTSVVSAYFDVNKPLRQLITQKWINNDSSEYKLCVSTLVLEEIGKTQNEQLRSNMLNLLSELNVNVLELDDEILYLAGLYREKVIPKEINDSIHIATASIYEMSA